MMNSDRMCVIHPNYPAVEVCPIEDNRNHIVVRDFCADCIEDGKYDDNFGRCYECADGLHERCIGVPCQCECPPTDDDILKSEIAETERRLETLRSRLRST